jgi:hypothetical protein
LRGESDGWFLKSYTADRSMFLLDACNVGFTWLFLSERTVPNFSNGINKRHTSIGVIVTIRVAMEYVVIE